jgi:hypothetical protein
MKIPIAVGAIVAGLAAVSGSAAADDAGPLAGKMWVRITAPVFAREDLVGHLVASEAASITVQREGSGERVAIPVGHVTRIEVRTQKSRRGHAAGIGALVGLGVGVAAGFAAGDDCGSPNAPTIVCISRPVSAVGVGVAGAGLGALIGLAVGAGEKWEAVEPARLHVSVTPSAGRRVGVGLALSLAF